MWNPARPRGRPCRRGDLAPHHSCKEEAGTLYRHRSFLDLLLRGSLLRVLLRVLSRRGPRHSGSGVESLTAACAQRLRSSRHESAPGTGEASRQQLHLAAGVPIKAEKDRPQAALSRILREQLNCIGTERRHRCLRSALRLRGSLTRAIFSAADGPHPSSIHVAFQLAVSARKAPYRSR